MVTSCVLWSGAVTSSGYGNVKIDGVNYLAHRVAYERAVGPVPPGMELHHQCGIKLCVNPAHLRLLTHRQHAKLHRRMAGLKLTDAQVAEIRRRSSESRASLAREFGVTPAYIGQLVRRKWRT